MCDYYIILLLTQNNSRIVGNQDTGKYVRFIDVLCNLKIINVQVS